MEKLSVIEHAGTLVVDSRLVAERLAIEHRSFSDTISEYQTQIEQRFGVLRFETAKPQTGSKGGRPQRYALLSEDQATFLMTLSRNTPEVVECKLDLVDAFSKAKQQLRYRSIPGVYWYERIKVAMSDRSKPLQQGYFCAYLEMMKFFQELEAHAGYVVPDTNPQTKQYIVPDISIAKKFNTWLRSEECEDKAIRARYLGSDEVVDFRKARNNRSGFRPDGKNRDEIVEYNHVFPEESHGYNNVQSVNSYPDKYLPIFRFFLSNLWIPKDCHRYISERDPEGWNYAVENLLRLPTSHRQALASTLVGTLIPSLPAAM